MSFDFPPVPDPVLQEVENTTAFPHMSFDKMGKGRLFYDVIACRMTFKLAPGVLELAEQQAPLVVADQYFDMQQPEHSSLKAAADILLVKPATDVLVTGTARHSHDKAHAHWLAGVRVCNASEERLIDHHMRLYGPRFWEYAPLRGWRIDGAQAVHETPLRHELGFGGHYAIVEDGKPLWKPYKRNPVGRGYLGPQAPEKDQLYPAARIELPRQPVTAMDADSPLACPAPVARFWADRLRYAGTYDADWRAQAQAHPIPDYPTDFDNRYFQYATPGLICPGYLRGDEVIHLAGLRLERPILSMKLPGYALSVDLIGADGRRRARPMRLDTLHIDLDAATVGLTWRQTLDQREAIVAARILPACASPA